MLGGFFLPKKYKSSLYSFFSSVRLSQAKDVTPSGTLHIRLFIPNHWEHLDSEADATHNKYKCPQNDSKKGENSPGDVKRSHVPTGTKISRALLQRAEPEVQPCSLLWIFPCQTGPERGRFSPKVPELGFDFTLMMSCVAEMDNVLLLSRCGTRRKSTTAQAGLGRPRLIALFSARRVFGGDRPWHRREQALSIPQRDGSSE